MLSPSPISLAAGPLSVEFTWNVDRFTHVLRDARGGAIAWAEAPGAESPVYVELHEQQPLLFLSGMSADRHWSMSVEATAEGRLVFDAACRAKSSAEHLASVYAVEGEGIAITPLATDGATPTFEREGDLLVVRPPTPLGGYPQTLRWRYEALPSS
ncbi:hypothetical protein Mal64_19680 [Pseudobythopirellula maris]|uniref:Uncharacterized protein n=1 Tax=Pseudobythopirellula maris TaxID=2527991 RepID=A0A5C5ZN39_9BACT|nr:hypothetical protein [Pseudobythopirellula maris]TWT88485.1 hypothetical protein Mal64_19680 [Pseudobythopirellula maris]